MKVEASNPRSSDNVGREDVEGVDIEEEIHPFPSDCLGKTVLLHPMGWPQPKP
jgi:hypothetical protein